MIDPYNDGTDWVRLARYLAGEASTLEAQEVERWITADPDRHADVVTLRELWERAGLLPAPSRIDSMWYTIGREIHAGREAPSPEPISRVPVLPAARRHPWRSTSRRRPWLAIGAIAASLLLGLVAFGSWRSAVGGEAAQADSAANREFRTARGETMTVQLVDGTRVQLGPDSWLSIRALPAHGPREIDLSGEAVFKVTHDEDRPFIVHSGHAVTEDLGTEFTVRAYPGECEIEVMVVEGRVALRTEGAPARSGTVLEEGQLGRLDAVGQVEVEDGTDPRAHAGWAQRRIVFRQTPLHEVAVELERWYNVEIEIADSSIAAQKLTLDIPAGALSDVLDAVVVPLKLRHERSGTSYRLYR